jgi:nucleoside-diphosphate-sugar epimerase
MNSRITGVEWINGDLCESSIWNRLPDEITHICHLAAKIPWQEKDKQRASVVSENILPAALLVENISRWHSLHGIVFSSSVSVYDSNSGFLSSCSKILPRDLYGASKLACESILGTLSVRNIPVAVLRLSSLYGTGQYQGSVLPIMINRAIHGEIINVHGDGTRTQDFLYCDDAAMAVFLACTKTVAGIFPLGSGTPTTMRQLAETVNEVFTGGRAKIIFSPEEEDGRPGIKVDITEARGVLGYDPKIQLEEGLRILKKHMEGVKK